MRISITTPIAFALENYYIWSFLGVPADILNHFWIQVAVLLLKLPPGGCSEVKRPLRNRFGSATISNL
jgi:hypothetical protein